MISADDQVLIARDATLTGLSLLLDDERMHERLAQALPDLGIRQVRAQYLRYKPGTSCLVSYCVELDDGPLGSSTLAIHAQTWGDRDESRFEKAEGRPLVRGALGIGTLAWRDVPALVWSFPNDIEVRALRRLGSDRERHALLRHVACPYPALLAGTIEQLAYKPGRRFAGAVLGAGGERAVLKLYSRSAYAARAWAEGMLASSAGMRTPSLLGRSDRHRAVLLEWLPGAMLGDLLRAPALPTSALTLAGAALAELHAQPAGGFETRRVDAGARGLAALADTLGFLLPERASAVTGQALRLSEQLSAPGDLVPVHGDLHAKQLVLDGDRIGLLDLDRAALAPRAEDLGNLFAHIERDEVLGRLPPGRSDEVAQALLAGYRAAGGMQPTTAAIAAERAAGLLRLAMQPFRDREPHWRRGVGTLLDRVAAAGHEARAGGRPF